MASPLYLSFSPTQALAALTYGESELLCQYRFSPSLVVVEWVRVPEDPPDEARCWAHSRASLARVASQVRAVAPTSERALFWLSRAACSSVVRPDEAGVVVVAAAEDDDEVVLGTITTEDELSTLVGRMVGTAGASAIGVEEGTTEADRVEVDSVVYLCLWW